MRNMIIFFTVVIILCLLLMLGGTIFKLPVGSENSKLLWTAVGGFVVFVIQAIIKNAIEIWRQQQMKRIEFLELQLTRFFWPLYLGFMKDDVTWNYIIQKDNVDGMRSALARKMEEDIILPNHMKNIQIIEDNIYLIHDDNELIEMLRQYLHHVSLYKAIRLSGDFQRFPLDYNVPYPSTIISTIWHRTQKLQNEYDQMIGKYSLS